MRDIPERTECPEGRELEAFAANPLKEEWADLAAHIAVCDRCRDAFAEALDGGEMETTPEDDAFIRDFTAAHCRRSAADAKLISDFVAKRRLSFVQASGTYSLAAAPAAGCAGARRHDDVRGPDEEVRFVYAAETGDAEDGFWRAELTIPPVAHPETMIDVSVSDVDRAPVAEGVLRIAGCALPISGGAASLPFSLFLDGLMDTDVSLSRAGSSPVPGRLLFF